MNNYYAFNEFDDFELCNYTFSLFPGNEINVKIYGEIERIITLAWHSYGIIGNGGFEYLFEGSFKGDPYYLITYDSYIKIEAFNAASAFQKAFEFFKNGKVPKNIKKRMKIYNSIPKKERDKINFLYWNSKDEVENRLANYIRLNQNSIEQFGSHKVLLNKDSLNSLFFDDVPEETVTKLESIIDFEYSENGLIDAIEMVLGDEETLKYKNLILSQAKLKVKSSYRDRTPHH